MAKEARWVSSFVALPGARSAARSARRLLRPGQLLVELFVDPDAHPLKLYIHEADGWPRYSMDQARGTGG
jgi:hypothetical protein